MVERPSEKSLQLTRQFLEAVRRVIAALRIVDGEIRLAVHDGAVTRVELRAVGCFQMRPNCIGGGTQRSADQKRVLKMQRNNSASASDDPIDFAKAQLSAALKPSNLQFGRLWIVIAAGNPDPIFVCRRTPHGKDQEVALAKELFDVGGIAS